MKGLILSTLLGLAATSTAAVGWPAAEGKAIKYTTVKGFFQQDEPGTDPSTYDYTAQNFGLLNVTYPTDEKFDPHGKKTQWERFARYVRYLNHQCSKKDDKVRYKLLVMGRHGEGYHNAAETYYGTPAWNCYWAELDGNGTVTWADSHLTPAGYQQAYVANAYFKTRFEQAGMPYFESYYSSPLTRCTETAIATYGNLTLPAARPFAPTIKELFREGISMHTCDRRSNKTYIHSVSPGFTFEAGFTEFDELWHRTEGETSAHQDARSQTVLDDVFTHDAAEWISVTSHSGEIAAILVVLGHQPFSLPTAALIPVLVKAEIEPEAPTTTSIVGFTSAATCDAPPVTSISGGACVCSSGTSAPATASATPTGYDVEEAVYLS